MKTASTHATRHIGATTISTVLFAACVGGSSLAIAAPVVGWVSYPETLAANALSIMRKGQSVGYKDEEGFLACDRVELKDLKKEVTLTLANNTRIRLSQAHSSVELPCDKPGIGDQLSAFFRAITQKADQRYEGAVTRIGAVSASSRGGVSATSKGAVSRSTNNALLATRGSELSIPALVAETAVISAGEHPLHLRWLGGKPPYNVVLAPYPKGSPLISKSNIAETQVTLPLAGIKPGRYVLTVKGSDGNGIEENDLHVMAAGSIPAMPPELASAALSKTAKTLFYADYLVGFEDGRWTMEALQQAASVAAGSPEAEEWLQRWGGTASKP